MKRYAVSHRDPVGEVIGQMDIMAPNACVALNSYLTTLENKSRTGEQIYSRSYTNAADFAFVMFKRKGQDPDD